MDNDADPQALCPGLSRRFKESQGISLDEALRSLYVLFIQCARLEDANPDWLVEFAGTGLPPNPYRDVRTAHRALHGHPIYRWLKRELKNIMAQVPSNPMQEFRFVLELLGHLHVASIRMTVAEGRPDKRRASAKKRIDALLGDIQDSTVVLPRSERALLRSLLERASRGLLKQTPKPISYPILQSLARTFVLFEVNDKKTKLLVDAATFMGIECDASTAERYTERAGKVWSGRSDEAKLDFHILEVLRDDYFSQKSALSK
jgi:hypothetical protein